MNLKITEINLYPVKGLGGISLAESEVGKRGLKFDRRWMIVDQNNQFITQRTQRKLALFKTRITSSELSIHYDLDTKTIPLKTNYGPTINVQVWNSNCESQLVDQTIDKWISDILGFNAKLVYMPETTDRLVNPEYAINKDIVSFADAYPILLLSEESLKNLNKKLDEPILMNRFRPNLVFSGGYQHIEDDILKYSINDCHFQNVKPCDRCVVTTINQATAERSKEPLKTLSTYRMAMQQVYFGMNTIPLKLGFIKLGDELKILSKQELQLNFSS